MSLHILLRFLHNRIPCKHNARAANNLTPLNMLFLSIIVWYNKPNKFKNHTSTFVYYLVFVKIVFHFYLGPAKTRAAGLFLPALHMKLSVTIPVQTWWYTLIHSCILTGDKCCLQIDKFEEYGLLECKVFMKLLYAWKFCGAEFSLHSQQAGFSWTTPYEFSWFSGIPAR